MLVVMTFSASVLIITNPFHEYQLDNYLSIRKLQNAGDNQNIHPATESLVVVLTDLCCEDNSNRLKIVIAILESDDFKFIISEHNLTDIKMFLVNFKCKTRAIDNPYTSDVLEKCILVTDSIEFTCDSSKLK